MDIVLRSPYRRWWIHLVTIAGAMLATPGAAACELGGEGSRDIASGFTRGGSVAPLGGNARP